MIELRITGETPAEFLQQIAVAANALLFRQAVVNAGAVPAAPVVGNAEKENPTGTTTDAPAEPMLMNVEPAKKPGRKKAAAEPAPETGAAATEIAPVAEEIEVPKDLDGMRALLGQVLQKFGVESVNAIVHPYAPVLSKVPVDKYPEIARLAHKKLAEDAA